MKQNMLVSCLEGMSFKSCACKEFLNPAGNCFEPDKSLGEGYYWYYERKDMFAVGLMDLKPKDDFIMEYEQPDFISVNYYDTISAEELCPYKKLSANCIRGHVAHGELFRAKFHKNMPLRGVELILMPGFYRDYLNTRYEGQFPNPESAFLSVDGSTDFPELILLLKQIAKFQGTGVSADLYYGSKAIEALSLIIDRTKREKESLNEKNLSDQDLINLDAVKSYIEDHFAYDIRAEQLSAIACMGQTKLRSSFKKVYGCTITDYIRTKRIAHAEYLLMKTDFNVSQVAEAVGYHNAGRFSGIFKESTGLYPDEYRKII